MKIYQVKISLKGSRPPIWRRILVQPDITFYRLHQIIQIAMDWDDYHLHQFVCTISESKRAAAEDIIDKKFRELLGASSWKFTTSIFTTQQKAYIGDPDQFEDFMPGLLFFNENEEILSNWLIQEKEKCSYTYDFGDNWEHEILLEKIIQADPNIRYPFCIKAKREAPLEDSGGMWNMDVDEEGRADQEIADEINVIFQTLK